MVISLNEQYNGGFLPDILMLTQAPIFLRKNGMRLDLVSIPQSGGKISKRLGETIGCKDKTSYDI